jgi:Fe-S-cluster containining protein
VESAIVLDPGITREAKGLAMVGSLTVLNLEQAKYECIYGRGCDGICCQTGRPPVYPEEKARIDDNLEKILPELRPEARKTIEKKGYLSDRSRAGLPLMRIQGGWCVFFNQGCVLHKIGAAEGDKYLYKPVACALFPLSKDDQDRWYVRQKGYKTEGWNLFCLDPNASPMPAREALKEEMALAEKIQQEQEDADSVKAK